ncbi:MAG: DUF1015 domain-containing protein [Oscillospiraceae bacterium]|nr:DUF1015 domain-containing protein [Oscillospiraceae bacterium]
MDSKVFSPGNILLPTPGTDMSKWSVVACDQFTSEPEYWVSVSSFVGDAPSTLNLTFPEIYLEDGDGEKRISEINENMRAYLDGEVFANPSSRYIYVERTQRDGKVRCGLMGVVDLEEYDYMPGSQSKIRATEGTVLERIPPRVKIRENAPLELPHIMLLIDDRKKSVIEPLANAAATFEKAYDFSLMENSGSIKGYFVSEEEEKRIDEALARLADKDEFEKKYSVTDRGVLQFAVGDGNHSLATAKECWKTVKATLSADEAASHPARFALCELVNLHDEALEFEPIHRVVFDIDPDDFLIELSKFYELSDDAEQVFEMVTEKGSRRIGIKNPKSNLTVGSLQKFIDEYLRTKGGRVDYIHGDEVVKRLGAEHGNAGFLLPTIAKDDLFPTVIRDGVLPRKAFSMGHAWDKRFYLEARSIRK